MAIEERQHTPVAERRHRVHAFAGRTHEVLDDILGVDGGSFVAMSELGVAATRETLLELSWLTSRIEALTAKVLDHRSTRLPQMLLRDPPRRPRHRAREVRHPRPERRHAHRRLERDRLPPTPRPDRPRQPRRRHGRGGRKADRGGAGAGVLRAHRTLPRRQAPHRGWDQRHRGGHHDPGHPRRGHRSSDPRHRPVISAGEARRLASPCGVIPAVLGTHSEVLDLGRTVRLHTPAQRTALRIRHKTCTAPGCSVPAAWCHAHHKTPWTRGGRTSIKDGTPLCPRHHRAIHRPGTQATYRDDGTTLITKTTRRRQ